MESQKLGGGFGKLLLPASLVLGRRRAATLQIAIGVLTDPRIRVVLSVATLGAQGVGDGSTRIIGASVRSRCYFLFLAISGRLPFVLAQDSPLDDCVLPSPPWLGFQIKDRGTPHARNREILRV